MKLLLVSAAVTAALVKGLLIGLAIGGAVSLVSPHHFVKWKHRLKMRAKLHALSNGLFGTLGFERYVKGRRRQEICKAVEL